MCRRWNHHRKIKQINELFQQQQLQTEHRHVYNAATCYAGLHCIPCSTLYRWNQIHGDDYARKVGGLLEAETVIPIEIFEFLRTSEKDYWNSVLMDKSMSVIHKNCKAMMTLLVMGAKNNEMTIEAYLNKWKDELCSKCGKEFCYYMFEQAEQLLQLKSEV